MQENLARPVDRGRLRAALEKALLSHRVAVRHRKLDRRAADGCPVEQDVRHVCAFD